MEESSRVQEGFKCCSMCMRHCFETHGDFGRSEAKELLSAPTFFSLIKTSHITGSKLLRIPVLFLEKQNCNIGGKLILRGPSGFNCSVTVQRHDHGYVLQTGFDLFLKQHMIEAGDALVFYLLANSNFVVKVYDRFGSEKVLPTKDSSDAELVLVSKMSRKSDAKHRSKLKASLHEEDTEDSEGEGSGEKVVDRMLKLRQKKFGKKLNFVDESPVSKNFEAGDVGDVQQLVSSEKQRSAQKRKLSAMSDAYLNEENKNEIDKSSESERLHAKKRQSNAAKALREKLNNRCQEVVMTHSHIDQHRVYLSRLPLPNHSTYLTVVDEDGEQYTVKWFVPQNGSRPRLTTGWNHIVVNHKLSVDDICIFEASDYRLITVHIFRSADYHNPTTENQQQEQDHRDDLQPSALSQAMSEELDGLGLQEDTASA